MIPSPSCQSTTLPAPVPLDGLADCASDGNPNVVQRTIYGDGGVVTGTVVRTGGGATVDTSVPCWSCMSPGGDLFKPCQCPTLIHRGCFRKWRATWINPRNYFSCPTCLCSYKIERLHPASAETTSRITKWFRYQIAKLWFSLFIVMGAIVTALALISWAADRNNKNVPVGMKYVLSSVVNGFPDRNSTSAWKEEFMSPDKWTWQYYTLLAVFLSSLVILLLFSLFGCSFDKNDKELTRCDCSSNLYCSCYSPCPTTLDCGNCDCCGHDCGQSCGGCSAPSCNTGGDDAAPLLLILLIIIVIIVVIVIFSAVFIVIVFAGQKMSVLYTQMAKMIRCQAQELEGETEVLDVNELWRPLNQV